MSCWGPYDFVLDVRSDGFQIYSHLDDFAVEPAVWTRVVFRDRRPLVNANVSTFIRGKQKTVGIFDSARGDFCAVHENRASSARAQLAAVCSELEPDRGFPRWYRLFSRMVYCFKPTQL